MARNMTISAIHEAYRTGMLTPSQLVDELLTESEQYADHNIWIRPLTRDEIEPYLQRLSEVPMDGLPLYGIPFVIKDNIDLAGVTTTAACEAFGYVPETSAYVVEQLINAGAIPMGKTNLDQFATGLVGVRSPEPWGVCKNSFNTDHLSGGSSSGSAVAVALGLASFSLGTDTAGSGRVPAGFNNLVGVKPTIGLLSKTGLVPACQSLDCISIFSLTTDDANTVFEVAAAFDQTDAYARPNTDTNKQAYSSVLPSKFTFAVPQADQLKFFGNDAYQALFAETVENYKAMGGEVEEIDFEPFLTAARLLYEGPWVAERRVATAGVDRADMLPVIQTILASQEEAKAEDLFKAQYALQACRQQVAAVMQQYDFVLTPTTGTHYTIDEVLADPVQLNSNLGYYTNFMNLLDFSAVATPAGFTEQGMPFGVTLFSRAFSDMRLLTFANALQQKLALPLGATGVPLAKTAAPTGAMSDRMIIAVCGAHLEGQPLNFQLTDRGATLVEKTKTSPAYRFYALAGGPPYRPGLVRDDKQGIEIEMELWSIPTATMGSFLSGIPAPLGLGKVETISGEWVTGFICEGYAIASSEDITHLGGWRAFVEQG